VIDGLHRCGLQKPVLKNVESLILHEKKTLNFERIAIIYRKEKLLEKEIAFIQAVLKTKDENKTYSHSYSQTYRRFEYRLNTAEEILARKNRVPTK